MVMEMDMDINMNADTEMDMDLDMDMTMDIDMMWTTLWGWICGCRWGVPREMLRMRGGRTYVKGLS